MRTLCLSAAALAAVLCGFGVALFLRHAARRVVMPQPVETVRILAASDASVSIPATEDTIWPGIFGIWSRSTEAHVIVGDIVKHTDSTIERRVIEAFGEPLGEGELVEFRRDLYRNPGEARHDYTEVTIRTPLGFAPAWLVPGAGPGAWVIHLHGIRTERRVVLPGVKITSQLGFTSLVPSWRGDGEGPAVRGGAATLGQDEAIDVAAAIDYALARGAQQVILVGWSMGGTIALKLASDPRYAPAVAALILVAPASNWRRIITHAVTEAGLPRALGSAISGVLSSRIGSRIVGTPAPIDIRALDWTGQDRVPGPAYVVHNPDDQLVPVALSQQLATHNPDVRLELFDPAPHAMEANVNPARFSTTLSTWLREIRTLTDQRVQTRPGRGTDKATCSSERDTRA